VKLPRLLLTASLWAALGCGAVHGLGADGAAGTGGPGAAGTGGGSGAAGAGGGSGAAGTAGSGAAGTGGGSGAAGSGGGSGAAGSGGGGSSGAAGGTVNDAGGDVLPGGDALPRDATTDVDGRACTVKINEVQTGGTTALDEFVELYNTCPDKAVDLSGYSLVYRSAAGTSDVPRVAFTTSQIAAGKPYFVCANTSFAGTADVRYTDGLAADGGGLALRAPDGRVVDAVGWGTATNAFVEGGAAAPAPQPSQSIARVPDGLDTDVNGSDFAVAAAPTPGAPNL
jgi:hypothetical protein